MEIILPIRWCETWLRQVHVEVLQWAQWRRALWPSGSSPLYLELDDRPCWGQHTCTHAHCTCTIFTLCASEAVAQCIVMSPVCLCVGGCVCLWICYHDNSKFACINPHQTGFAVVTISSWLNFGHPATIGKGSAVGRKFLAPSYYSQHAVFASLWALFSLQLCTYNYYNYNCNYNSNFRRLNDL